MIREVLIECRAQPTFGSVRAVRQELEAALAPLVGPTRVSDVLLVVSELCTNAVEATGGNTRDVVVRVGVAESGNVVVEVEDGGSGFGRERHAPGELDDSGRGLKIVRVIADEVSVERRRRKTLVRALLVRNEALELAGDVK